MGDTPRLVDAVSSAGNLMVKDRMDIFIGFDSAWADNPLRTAVEKFATVAAG